MEIIKDRYSLYLGDCLEIMKQIPDKSVDLILTDPPYGLNKKIHDGGTWSKHEKYDACLNWDFVPSLDYFLEIFRISKNQIIWGGNYFVEYLKNSRCWLVWQKPYFPTLADAELAWTSFDMNVRVYKTNSRVEDGQKQKEHPTQKPVKLMKWCIENYSKPNDLILDCFMGSGTTGVAALSLDRRFIGIEQEPKYFGMSKKRIELEANQTKLFAEEKKEEIINQTKLFE